MRNLGSVMEAENPSEEPGGHEPGAGLQEDSGAAQ